MKSDTVKQYISLGHTLRKEKADLETRLREINLALSEPAVAAGETRPMGAAQAIPTAERPRSLKEAVIQVTSVQPLTKQEILDAIGTLGFRFGGKDPMNSLGTILYGKTPRFNNENGRFSPILAQAQAKAVRPKAVSTKEAPAKRTGLSDAARAKISAAARARWAKVKKAGGRSLKTS